MFRIRDFFNHPLAPQIIDRLLQPTPGLIVLTGSEARPASDVIRRANMDPAAALLPSGRQMIFRSLLDEWLEANPESPVVRLSARPQSERSERPLRGRLTTTPLLTTDPAGYAAAIRAAARQQPGLLVLDELNANNLGAALEAADRGTCVLGQMDSPLRAAAAARALLNLGVTEALLVGLRWIISVQRAATLCPACSRPHTPEAYILEQVQRLPALAGRASEQLEPGASDHYHEAVGCPSCSYTGRQGDAALLDVYHIPPGEPPLAQNSLLPLEACLWRLARLGQTPMQDVLDWDQEQMRRAYNALAASEYALATASSRVEEKRSELEAANRVLEQRTQALFSFQAISQALISSTDLAELAQRMLRRAVELCGGEMAVLYYLRPSAPDKAEILAASGWPSAPHGRSIPAEKVTAYARSFEPAPYTDAPPGIQENLPLPARCGLHVPLVAQGTRVGAIILQSARKERFTQGEVAMLQAFANQAALFLQRADLVEALQKKVHELEAAQAELAKRERIEREMELARQVQQSVLPRSFPSFSGYTFAARSDPARQVGGDFYDVIALQDGRFGLAIADVSDKGLPAALYMALTRSLLLAEARRGDPPARVLEQVNDLLHLLGVSKMFVTVFYAVVDPGSGQIAFARAGHDRPLLLHAGNIQELGGSGMPLGLFQGEAFNVTEQSISLEPGDRLVMYTDGLTDVCAPGGQMYGREQLLAHMHTCYALDSQAICQATFAELGAYRQECEQFDDMTLLVVSRE